MLTIYCDVSDVINLIYFIIMNDCVYECVSIYLSIYLSIGKRRAQEHGIDPAPTT